MRENIENRVLESVEGDPNGNTDIKRQAEILLLK